VVNNIILISLMLLIGTMAYFLLDTILYLWKNNKYKMRTIKPNMDGGEGESRSKKTGNYLNYLEHLVDEAGNGKFSVKKTISLQITLSVLFLVLAFVVYYFTGFVWVLPIGIILIPLIIFQTIKELKNEAIARKNELRNELLNYLVHFGMMLQDYAPHQATIKSIEYAKGSLLPYVQKLITRINLNSADFKPYKDFADELNIIEAKEFAMILEQVLKVDAAKASMAIQNMIDNMEKLQDDLFDRLIETTPQRTKSIINRMYYPFLITIGGMILTLVLDTWDIKILSL